jgi:hypothetical protein
MENINNITNNTAINCSLNIINDMSTINDSNIDNNNANKRRSSLRNWAPPKHQQKLAKKVMLDQAVAMYVDAVQKNNGKNVSPSTFKLICQTFGNPDWMSRHTIFYHYKKHVIAKNDDTINTTNNPPSEISVLGDSQVSDISTVTSNSRNKGGRPSGLQTTTIDEWKTKLKIATTIACKKYNEAKNPKKYLANGAIDNIIKDSLKEVNLPMENYKYISKKTIASRINRKNLLGMEASFSQCSPMSAIEPLLAKFCLH